MISRVSAVAYYRGMSATTGRSKANTISLPPELARSAKALAKLESRTISGLFREAFRVYSSQRARRTLGKLSKYAASHNPNGYTEADVPRLIRETRAE